RGRRFAAQPALGLGDLAESGFKDLLDELPVALEVPRRVVVPVQDEDDVAAGLVLGERLRVDRLGAAARRVLREEGEFLVLRYLAPRRRRVPSPEHDEGPGRQQEGPPPTNHLAEKTEDHGAKP